MSYRLLAESWPVAAKPHRCIWCGEPIPVGERHRHESSIFESHFQSHRWHKECDAAAAEYFRDNCGESEFAAHENERPTTAGGC